MPASRYLPDQPATSLGGPSARMPLTSTSSPAATPTVPEPSGRAAGVTQVAERRSC